MRAILALRALDAAKVGGGEKLDGFTRLERFSRGIERRFAPAADFARVVAHERVISPLLDGRVAGNGRLRSSQLSLFD